MTRVSKAFASSNRADLVNAERDVIGAFDGVELDLAAMAAVSNIYRVANAVRNHMESTVLARFDLSWSAFVVLWVLRVWGDQESHALAAEAGITGGTLTGVVKTMEAKGLAQRRPHPTDGRRVMVGLTDKGRDVIDRAFPEFNAHEAMVTSGLSERGRRDLANSLRTIQRTVAELDDHADG